jgi:hypothetical protein
MENLAMAVEQLVSWVELQPMEELGVVQLQQLHPWRQQLLFGSH